MIDDEERRAIGGWTAACAERVLPLFEATVPHDARPRAALVAIRAFAIGGPRTKALRDVAWAALAAARETADPIASAAATACGLAAASAYIHAKVTPHQSKHILAVTAHAVLAAGDAELRWAIAHAPLEVRAVLRRLPPRVRGRGRIDAPMYELDAALRA